MAPSGNLPDLAGYSGTHAYGRGEDKRDKYERHDLKGAEQDVHVTGRSAGRSR
jgi:hypothetical protein